MGLIVKITEIKNLCNQKGGNLPLLNDLQKLIEWLASEKLENLRQQQQLSQSLMSVTRKIVENSTLLDSQVVDLWKKILQECHGKSIPRFHDQNHEIDCSIALKILTTKALPSIVCEKVDLTDPKVLEEAVDTDFEIKKEFFPENANRIPRWVITGLMKNPKTECYLAKIGQKCVAIFWGTHYQVGASSQFYVHFLGCKGSVATLGIGNTLFKTGMDELFKNNVEYVTLEAYKDHEQTLRFYNKHQFRQLPEEKEDDQYAFAKAREGIQSPLPMREAVKTAVQAMFSLITASLFQNIFNNQSLRH